MSELLKRFATLFAMLVAVLVTACSTETPDPTLNYIVNSGSSTTADADTDVDVDTDTDVDVDTDVAPGLIVVTRSWLPSVCPCPAETPAVALAPPA